MHTINLDQSTIFNRRATSFIPTSGPIKSSPESPHQQSPVFQPPNKNPCPITLESPAFFLKHSQSSVPSKRNSWPSTLLENFPNFKFNTNQKIQRRSSQCLEAKPLPNTSSLKRISIKSIPVAEAVKSSSYKKIENIESNNFGDFKSLNNESDEENLLKSETASNVALITQDIQKFKINVDVKENLIIFYFNTRAKRNLRRIKCEISVFGRNVKCKFILQHFNFEVLPESLEVLKQFLMVLNIESKDCKFSMEKSLVFEKEFQEIPEKFYKKVEFELNTILIPQFDMYYGICIGKIDRHQKLEFKHFESTFVEVCHKLNEMEMEKEKNIIEKMGNFEGILVLNRFFFNHIKFFHEEVKYYVKKNSESVENGLKRHEYVFEQFQELVEMLQKCGLYVKESFSVDFFRWFQERPVFAYDEPLFKVFEMRTLDELEAIDYNSRVLKKIKESLQLKMTYM
jgi:hypothetical protein